MINYRSNQSIRVWGTNMEDPPKRWESKDSWNSIMNMECLELNYPLVKIRYVYLHLIMTCDTFVIRLLKVYRDSPLSTFN